VKITVEGVDGEGKPAHNDWIGKFDGKIIPSAAILLRTRVRTRRWTSTR
jgi:hypothetical protein